MENETTPHNTTMNTTLHSDIGNTMKKLKYMSKLLIYIEIDRKRWNGDFESKLTLNHSINKENGRQNL